MTKEEIKWLEEVKANFEKAEERKKEARSERNELISRLCIMNDKTVGKGFKAFTNLMKEGELAEINSEEVAVAHDLIAEIIFLDEWEC